MKSVILFENTNVAAFDEHGNQIPALQRSLIVLWAEFAEKQGYNPDGLVIDAYCGRIKLFRVEGGWNFEIVPDGVAVT